MAQEKIEFPGVEGEQESQARSQAAESLYLACGGNGVDPPDRLAKAILTMLYDRGALVEWDVADLAEARAAIAGLVAGALGPQALAIGIAQELDTRFGKVTGEMGALALRLSNGPKLSAAAVAHRLDGLAGDVCALAEFCTTTGAWRPLSAEGEAKANDV